MIDPQILIEEAFKSEEGRRALFKSLNPSKVPKKRK